MMKDPARCFSHGLPPVGTQVKAIPDYLALAGVFISFLVGLAWLIPRIRAGFRVLDSLEAIVTRELTHNHGTSMKDDVYGTAIASRRHGERLDTLEDGVAELDRRLSTLAEANNLIWPAIEAVANAQPPPHEGHKP